MKVRKIEIERLTITSSKPFETVVAALEAAIGRPDMAEFMTATRSATTYAELQTVVQQSVSAAGLMLFMKLDAGAVMRSESGLASPKAQRFLIGNPLIMKDMAKPQATLQSQCWSMSDRTGCISATTRWQACSHPTAMWRRWPWRASWMPRSRS